MTRADHCAIRARYKTQSSPVSMSPHILMNRIDRIVRITPMSDTWRPQTAGHRR
jgi:hypothetical protein